jgi:hypothetical protein
VLVMREGTVAGELPAQGATEEDVLHLASTPVGTDTEQDTSDSGADGAAA